MANGSMIVTVPPFFLTCFLESGSGLSWGGHARKLTMVLTGPVSRKLPGHSAEKQASLACPRAYGAHCHVEDAHSHTAEFASPSFLRKVDAFLFCIQLLKSLAG